MRTWRRSDVGLFIAAAVVACTPDYLPLDNPISGGGESGSGGSLPTTGDLSASGGMEGTDGGSSSGDADSGGSTTGSIEQDADGWLVFLADVHDGPEIYAIRDNGEEPIQLSLPLEPAFTGATVKEAVVNHNGTRVAWTARGSDGDGVIWVMNLAGGDISQVASSGSGVYRLGWSADNKTLFYVNNLGECGEALYTVDVETLERRHAWKRNGAAAFTPIPCPVNADLVLYRDSVCRGGKSSSSVMLWDRSNRGSRTKVIVEPSTELGFNTFSWAEGCSAIFLRQAGGYIHRVDFDSPERPLVFSPGTSLVQRGVVGNDGGRLYLPRCIIDDCDIWVVDLTQPRADAYPLGASLWDGSETLSWARIEVEIDENGNGVADWLDQ